MVFEDRVDANVEMVVAWWFHPDRRAEYLDLAQPRGALDVTSERTREGGMAVMRLRYRTAQGWEFDHRLEADLDNDGRPHAATVTGSGIEAWISRPLAPAGSISP
jgi:hypothetical protein